jgi:hypothetical protein
MIHTPIIIDTKELSDEQVSYCIRCCGDPSTDSWHMISILCPTKDDPRTHEEQLFEIAANVAAKHEAKVSWRLKNATSVTLPASNL